MTADVPNNVKKGVNKSLIISIFLIVLGVVATLVPAVSTIVAETWIAVILLSAGGAKLVYAFNTRDEGGFIWKLLLSILYIGAGVMLLVYPLTGVLTLTLLIGSFLLTEGAFEAILALRLRPQPRWTWVLFDGIITLVLGGFVWFQWPFDAPWLLGTLVGISVLFTGISRAMLSLNADQPLNHSEQAT
jgi:uncharacterized membrane protein HdeD (DUF308 family)